MKNELHNQSYHPDEPLIFDFVHRSHIVRPAGEAEYYNYGTLYYAILRSAEWLGAELGGVPPPVTFEPKEMTSAKQWDDVNSYIAQSELSGRYASALAGAATAVIVFLILRRWTAFSGALAGVALIVISPAHMEHSRFQTVDIISLFFVALTSLACLRLLRPGLVDPRRWVFEVCLAGILAGASASTRYTDGLLVLSIWTAIALQRPKNWPILAAAAGFAAVVAFVLTTPGSITDTHTFIANLQYQASQTAKGNGLVFVGRPPGYLYHLEEMSAGIGLLGLLVGLSGLLYAAFRKHAWAWVILAFFVPTYLLIGSQAVMFLRYEFPLYLGVACGFGYAISAIRRRGNSAWLAAGVALLALIGVESPQSGIRGCYLFTEWMAGIDPRDSAGLYLKGLAQKTSNAQVGILGDAPWFWSAAIVKDASFLRFQSPRFKNGYLAHTQDPNVVTFASGANPQFATYSSFEVEDALRLSGRTDLDPSDSGEVQLVTRRVEDLNNRYQVIATFGGDGPTVHDLEYIRPTIWVMQRRDLPPP